MHKNFTKLKIAMKNLNWQWHWIQINKKLWTSEDSEKHYWQNVRFWAENYSCGKIYMSCTYIHMYACQCTALIKNEFWMIGLRNWRGKTNLKAWCHYLNLLCSCIFNIMCNSPCILVECEKVRVTRWSEVRNAISIQSDWIDDV